MRPSIVLIRKFRQFPGHERLLLLEAILWLAVARFAIAMLPFRYVGRIAGFPVFRQAPQQEARAAAVERIRWAIVACARRVPWRAICFEQGLTAQLMLRRRGMPSVLFYGAAPDDWSGIAAHVWVRDGDVDVIGCEIASRFVQLATFPPERGSSPDKRSIPQEII